MTIVNAASYLIRLWTHVRSCEHVGGNQCQPLSVQGRGYDECCAKTSSEGSGILTKRQRDEQSRLDCGMSNIQDIQISNHVGLSQVWAEKQAAVGHLSDVTKDLVDRIVFTRIWGLFKIMVPQNCPYAALSRTFRVLSRPSRIGTWNIIMFSCAYFVLKIYSRIVFKLHL